MSVLKGFRSTYFRGNCKGATVIELMMTITLAGIILSLAVPALKQFLANNQIVSTSNSIVSGLNMARTTAVHSGEDITICPSSNGSSCAVDTWDDGWIVFKDLDNDGEADDSEILRVVVIEGNVSSSGFGGSVVFQSDGTTDLNSSATLLNCHDSESYSATCMQVVINQFGKISSGKQLSNSGLNASEG